MGEPVRLQLSRRKGFDLQALSRATNGLEAVAVVRPHRWGNPFVVGRDGDANECVRLYREFCIGEVNGRFRGLDKLRGKNLACFCKPTDVCHADTLLALAANRPPS